MKLRLDIEVRGGLLLVAFHGTVSFDGSLSVLKRVLDRACKERLSRILIDARPVDGVLSTFERYELGKQTADYIKERRMNPRVAFVGEPPVVDGFGVRVAQNLGITVDLFFTRQEALSWLAAWPEPPRKPPGLSSGRG
jgi:hypothetical protein